jgi:hypothetical protein
MPFRRVAAEVEAGRDGDTGRLEQVAREAIAVVGQGAAIGVEVESTFRLGRQSETEVCERRRQEVAPAPKLRRRFEDAEGGGRKRRARRAAPVSMAR